MDCGRLGHAELAQQCPLPPAARGQGQFRARAWLQWKRNRTLLKPSPAPVGGRGTMPAPEFCRELMAEHATRNAWEARPKSKALNGPRWVSKGALVRFPQSLSLRAPSHQRKLVLHCSYFRIGERGFGRLRCSLSFTFQR